jgi:glucose-6-phosphate isomerase, archaeal
MFSRLEKTGLPIDFDPDTCEVAFADLKDPLYGVRRFADMRPVLADPDCSGPDVMYWMYRATGKRTCGHLLRDHALRYDLSVFKHGMMGREYFKTSGHYHPPVPHGAISYPEVYEVASGVALYLLQKVDDYKACPHEVTVEDFIVLRAEAGEKAMMPPDYGHVTVNSSGAPMVMTNWVCSEFKSYYDSVALCHGFAYYLISENGTAKWVPNPAYQKPLPPIRFARPKDVPELGIAKSEPMYLSAEREPERFRFISRPEAYLDAMWSALEFVDGAVV